MSDARHVTQFRPALARTGHSLSRPEPHTIGLHSERELFMHRELIRDGLLVTLAGRYEEDPVQFVTLSKRTLDSAVAREAVAELRNEGYVEEQVRGVIRLTPRGYRAYRNEPLPYDTQNHKYQFHQGRLAKSRTDPDKLKRCGWQPLFCRKAGKPEIFSASRQLKAKEEECSSRQKGLVPGRRQLSFYRRS